jgi:hypothetical protein
VGLPTSCFGETRHWVNGITVVPEIQLAPGVTVPAPPLTPGTPPGTPAPGALPPPMTPPPATR